MMTIEPPSWKFTDANPATVEMFRLKSVQELTALGPWDLSPQRQPDGRNSGEKAREMIATALREGSHFFEWTHKRTRRHGIPGHRADDEDGGGRKGRHPGDGAGRQRAETGGGSPAPARGGAAARVRQPAGSVRRGAGRVSAWSTIAAKSFASTKCSPRSSAGARPTCSATGRATDSVVSTPSSRRRVAAAAKPAPRARFVAASPAPCSRARTRGRWKSPIPCGSTARPASSGS